MEYNTLKNKRFKIAIKQGAKTKAEAGRIAGYSPKSRTLYERHTKTNNMINEVLPNEAEIENDFVKGKELALKAKDLSNFNRSNEALARIKGMFKDKTELTNKNPDTIIIVDKSYRSSSENTDKKLT